MNTFSHIIMGRLLCRYVKENHGVLLDQTGFITGNCLPDYQITLITRPHYMRHCLEYVQRETADLAHSPQRSAWIDRQFSRRLGILCHYYADFFCFAHNDHFTKNLAVHVRYESALHRFLTEKQEAYQNMRLVSETDIGTAPADINDTFLRHHKSYAGLFPCYESDILCALQTCAHVVVSVTRCAQEAAAQEPENFSHMPAAV